MRLTMKERKAVTAKTATRYCRAGAFVDRGPNRRIISLRFAERREVKHYVENYP